MLLLGDVVMGESFCGAPQFGASQSLGRAPSPSTLAAEHSQQLKALIHQHKQQRSGEFGTSSILVDSASRRWGEGSSLKSAGSPATSHQHQQQTPSNNAMNLSVNTSPSIQRRTRSNCMSNSRFLFSDIVTNYNVTVDTLTHGASNHTLQLAQPLTGDSARNYRRNEARVLQQRQQPSSPLQPTSPTEEN